MEKQKIGYTQAIDEIEQILQKFNSEEFDVDMLATQVKRATELIALCKNKLRVAEEDVAKILKQE